MPKKLPKQNEDWDDDELVLKAIHSNGLSLQRASPRLQKNPSYILIAAINNAKILLHLPPLADAKLALKIVCNNPQAFQYIPEPDSIFIKNALKTNGSIFQFLNHSDRDNFEYAELAMNTSAVLLGNASERLRNHPVLITKLIDKIYWNMKKISISGQIRSGYLDIITDCFIKKILCSKQTKKQKCKFLRNLIIPDFHLFQISTDIKFK